MEATKNIKDEKIDEFLNLINLHYPDWQGLNDPRFLKEEINDKRKASKKAKGLLGKNNLQKLLNEENYDEILKRIEKVGQSTNLLYNSTPKSGDLSIIYKENLNKKEFCQEFFDLIYDEKPIQDRMTKFIQYTKKNKLPNKWVFVTYFLFLIYPETEFFIKPSKANMLNHFINGKNSYASEPSPPWYNYMKKIVNGLKDKLIERKYNIQDMIEIQSLIWVAMNYLKKKEKIEKYLQEFNKVANDWFKNEKQLEERYNFFKQFIKKENLETAEWKDFQEMGKYIHSFVAMPIARANALGKPNHPIEYYRNSFLYLVYGEDDIEERIRNFCTDKKYKLKYFGNSAISEILSYIFPDKYVIYNRRDIQAIEFLGIKIPKNKGDKFIDKFIKYNNSIQTVIGMYQNIIGEKTNMPINYEIDQFFNFLYEIYLSKKEEDTETKSEVETEKNYWLIAPGESARLWKDFKKNNIVAIGWSELGNLAEYKTRAELKAKMQNIHKKDSSFKNDVSACFDFVNTMKIGDYVYIKKGRNEIIGLGEITSDFFYDDNREEYFNCRKVKWLKTDVWEISKSIPLKTLTQLKANDEIVKKYIPTGKKSSYSIDTATEDLFISKKEFQDIINILKYKKNIILQGPPGVGKTFIAKRLAFVLIQEKNNDNIEMIQFHQSYSYEDFMQGYRPTNDGGFKLQEGVFYKFCKKAQDNPQKKYVFIIDEINRGNLSKIFGELMMLIEKDKRGEEFAIPLTYSDKKFYIPENLYFIGTMNTADRSLAIVDYALRRRFGFITLKPSFENDKFKEFLTQNGIDTNLIDKIIQNLSDLNKKIKEDSNLGEDFQIGHSYFCPDDNDNMEMEYDDNWYKNIIKNEIKPLLEEYWFDNNDTANKHYKDLK